MLDIYNNWSLLQYVALLKRRFRNSNCILLLADSSDLAPNDHLFMF